MKEKNINSWSIVTSRLTLRDFQESDLADFIVYRSDSKLCEFQDFMVHTEKEVRDFYESQKEVELGSEKDWKQIAIANKLNTLIGDCAFKCDEHEKRIAEIGITIRSEYHNQGYAHEALNALITYAFGKLDIHKITAIIDIRNIASQKLFNKLNFTKEAHLKKHYWDKSKEAWYDEYHYGLLKEDHIITQP